MARHVLRALAAVLFLLAAVASASVAEVPAERQALVLVRALAYDTSLTDRAGEQMVVGVLTRAGHAASEQTSAAVVRAFQALGNVKVQGLPLKVVKVVYSTGAALSSAVRSQGLDALYICPGLEADLPTILAVTRTERAISMAAEESAVQKGASLGVFTVEGKPTVFVNLPASRLEGADFTSDLLRLAKVIK